MPWTNGRAVAVVIATVAVIAAMAVTVTVDIHGPGLDRDAEREAWLFGEWNGRNGNLCSMIFSNLFIFVALYRYMIKHLQVIESRYQDTSSHLNIFGVHAGFVPTPYASRKKGIDEIHSLKPT